jgi:hypothetical protein
MFVVVAVVAVGLVEVGTVLFSDRPQALRASIARRRANRQWSRHSRRRWRRQVRSTGMEIPTVELARLVPRDFLVSEYVRYQARGLWPWLEDALRLVMFIAAGVCGMALLPRHGSADWPVVLSCIGVEGVVAVMYRRLPRWSPGLLAWRSKRSLARMEHIQQAIALSAAGDDLANDTVRIESPDVSDWAGPIRMI